MKRRRKKHIKTPVGWTLTTGLYEVHFDGNLYDRVRMTVVAIGQMEAMFSRGQEKRNPAAVHDPSCL